MQVTFPLFAEQRGGKEGGEFMKIEKWSKELEKKCVSS
jgi:hypothetical protein